MEDALMEEALALARAGLGRVWPNPSVGCLIVNDGHIVGRGATQAGGRPHAEVVALADAGPRAEGSTVYVSLEPCAHYGKTPPCADALVRARIARCVVALKDPDPRVNGKGLQKLESAGIEVLLGPGAEEARRVNEGFFSRVQRGRPLVTLLSDAPFPDGAGLSGRAGHDASLSLDDGEQGVWAVVQGTGVAPVRWWVGGELPLGSQAWRRFHCPPGPHGIEPAAVLGQLGAQGLTRVQVHKADALFELLERGGLIDREE